MAQVTQASLRAREMRVRTAALKKALAILENMNASLSGIDDKTPFLGMVLQATAQQPKGCGEA